MTSDETSATPENAPEAAPQAGGPWVIRHVEFETSGTQRKHFPKEPSLPEIAFVGRSNVGKSSLLNALVNRKRLAHVSSTPGRTQLVNFFMVNGDTRLVDLPGYGFAKAPKEVKQHWDKMITNYLLGNRQLRLVVTLFDSRRDLTPEDESLLNWLKHYDFPFLVVITKSDKLNRSQQAQKKRQLTQQLAPWNPKGVVLFSALNRSGRDELLIEVGRLLAESSVRDPRLAQPSEAANAPDTSADAEASVDVESDEE